jgi:hypothetical protein
MARQRGYSGTAEKVAVCVVPVIVTHPVQLGRYVTSPLRLARLRTLRFGAARFPR